MAPCSLAPPPSQQAFRSMRRHAARTKQESVILNLRLELAAVKKSFQEWQDWWYWWQGFAEPTDHDADGFSQNYCVSGCNPADAALAELSEMDPCTEGKTATDGGTHVPVESCASAAVEVCSGNHRESRPVVATGKADAVAEFSSDSSTAAHVCTQTFTPVGPSIEEKQVVHFTANVRRAELYDSGKTLVMYAGADDAAPCSILDLPRALLPAALQEAREKQIRIKSYLDAVCPPTLKEKFEKKQDSDPDWLFLQQQLETLLGAMRGPVSTMEPVIDNREEVLDDMVQTGMEAMLSSVKSDGAKQMIHRCLGRLRFTLRRHMDDMMP